MSALRTLPGSFLVALREASRNGQLLGLAFFSDHRPRTGTGGSISLSGKSLAGFSGKSSDGQFNLHGPSSRSKVGPVGRGRGIVLAGSWTLPDGLPASSSLRMPLPPPLAPPWVTLGMSFALRAS